MIHSTTLNERRKTSESSADVLRERIVYIFRVRMCVRAHALRKKFANLLARETPRTCISAGAAYRNDKEMQKLKTYGDETLSYENLYRIGRIELQLILHDKSTCRSKCECHSTCKKEKNKFAN